MFSIAAINDNDTSGQREPLAPTKEAQEFHLTQTYHEGILKLQGKQYDKARELLQAVIKDPLISTDQADGSAGDNHLLQLKFLSLKNLATVFLEQGPDHYESALHCYLQAVEIDTKDSVVWNQLGTLACSMGLLSISRWAFEQGLVCSPNNWNCMEKLLEVLIAIGDEVACLSVAELILRHWPSHARALHVRKTIEESEPIPFAPRGIDKLEPKHVRLKFVDKRKASDNNLDENIATKRLNQTIELQLEEPSWTALADTILQVVLPNGGCDSGKGDDKRDFPGDTKIAICLPTSLKNGEKSSVHSVENITTGECNTREESISIEKEVHYTDEQIHERRSSRLESLRSHKTGKEDTEFDGIKDVEKSVIRSLQPFILAGQPPQDFDYSSGSSSDNEWQDVKEFVTRSTKNFGAYHFGHLLLEEAAKIGLLYRDTFIKLLELEKMTRLWGCDRTPECNLFLAELYHDIGSLSSNSSLMSEFMSEASYHLSKIIESVALDCPSTLDAHWGKSLLAISKNSQNGSKIAAGCLQRLNQSPGSSILTEKSSFWVRYFWLSGLVSVWEGNRARAHEEFSVSLSLLENNRNLNDIPGSIKLPHCKVNKELTTDKILHEINLLEVQFLLKNTVAEMLEKEMYMECIDLLAPLLLSTKGVHVDVSPTADKDTGVTRGELSALDVLIEACEKAKSLNIEVYLKCHRHKLQILMVAAGMEDSVTSCERFDKKPSPISTSGAEAAERPGEDCFNSIAEHVKAISRCASLVKDCIDRDKHLNDITVPRDIIGDIQTLLLSLMCNIARTRFTKKSSGVTTPDQAEQKQKCFFVNAVIAFRKLQLIDLTLPIKTQVDLIVAIHDLLAEFGLCCVGEDGEGVDGTFLKVAIKHLLTLDTELKSKYHSSNKTAGESLSRGTDGLVSESNNLIVPDSLSPLASEHGQDRESCGDREADMPISKHSNKEESSEQVTPVGSEIAEDEMEELELTIDDALNQCFFCLYGLNLRSDSTYEDDLAIHRNTSQADYQSKEQCADVFKYILPYAKDTTKTRLLKLRRVLRAIRKHFPQPPDDILVGNPIDKYLDEPNICEDKLSEAAGSDGFLECLVKAIFPDTGILKQKKISIASCEPYMEVYSNLYYLLAQSEETSATDKWPGFVLTKEGEDFVEQSTNLSKYDLLFSPLRFESWQRLANIYDEEVDLLLNDGSKNINVTGWRKNASLPQRVETSRRRSRRCLLMSLALAKTSEQQSEIHELLALVYYDGIQNVVPFYDQRSVAPSKDAIWMMFCKNSKKHFEKAFTNRQDWSHAFYLGKLCEKLGFSPELSFSYYQKAIDLNPSAVDAIYRMHASRLKLLYTSQRTNIEVLQVSAAHSFNQATKEAVMNIIERVKRLDLAEVDINNSTVDIDGRDHDECHQLDNVWNLLYNDCLCALEACVEGDLKHFHKARFMLARGLYKRCKAGDLEKAKDEMSFCFKSSRSSFTINMWEIDSTTKKGRRRAAGIGGSKKVLEVNLPESSRKFITCIRKYLLFYLKLLEETRDVCTLDRAYVFIRADKRFSLCLEDLVPVALGRYLKSLISSMLSSDASASTTRSSPEQTLEKMFTLFMEQGSLWSDLCSLPEIKCPELTDSRLYGYLHQYLYSLEGDVKFEVLEGINEKIRKRSRNPKLSDGNCAGVFKHASVAWCRSLMTNLSLITPLHSGALFQADADTDNNQLLCVDLRTKEFWSSSFGDATHLANLETKWNSLLSQVNHVIIRKTSEENLETANSLLRSSYSFYRDSSSIVLTSGINLFWVPARLVTTGQYQAGTDGIEIVDMSVPRKLLMWAYTLLHGRCSNISTVVKYCEENVKAKSKKGSVGLLSSSTCSTTAPAAQSGAGGVKDGSTTSHAHGGCEAVVAPSTNAQSSALPEASVDPSNNETQKILSTSQQLHHCNNNNNTGERRRTFDLNDDADPEKC